MRTKSNSHNLPSLEQFDGWVFDMDGTLYDQARLHSRIIPSLLLRTLPEKGGIRKLRIIREYRRIRELLADDETTDIFTKQYSETSRNLNISVDEIKSVTDFWLQEAPLRWLRQCAFPGVHELFEKLHLSSTPIAIVSDYPVEKKMIALGLTADIQINNSAPDVSILKPNPKGINKALDLLRVNADNAVMVGDRYSRDGASAQRVGIAYVHKSKVFENNNGNYYFRHYHQILERL